MKPVDKKQIKEFNKLVDKEVAKRLQKNNKLNMRQVRIIKLNNKQDGKE